MKIHHDMHTHTQISACCHDILATPENYIKKAAELGHTTFGFSNHLWDESVDGAIPWYHDQSFTHILPEKEIISKLEHYGINILFGAEVEYCGMTDTLALRAENAHALDYVLIPHTHTHFQGFVIPEIKEVVDFRKNYKMQLTQTFPWMSDKTVDRMSSSLKMSDMIPCLDYSRAEYEKFIANFMLTSYDQLLANTEFEKIRRTIPVIIAHPFSPSESGESFQRIYDMMDKQRLKKLLLSTAQKGIAFDINMCTYRFLEDLEHDPMVKIMKTAKECGVKFTFGSDAHSIEALSTITKHGEIISDAIGITEADIFSLI